MLKTFVLLFCLSVTLGEYFFVWHSFMSGISSLALHHRGFALLNIGSRHANEKRLQQMESVLNLRVLIIVRFVTSL